MRETERERENVKEKDSERKGMEVRVSLSV